MGVEFYPVFKPRVAAAEFANDGKLLLAEHQTLDAIASDLGVNPFTAFCDNRDVPDDFDGDTDADADDLEELLGDWDEWFSIENGLKTIDSLITAIEGDTEIASRFESAEYILEDLKELSAFFSAFRPACVLHRPRVSSFGSKSDSNFGNESSVVTPHCSAWATKPTKRCDDSILAEGQI
jgi:hypothetical protein